MMFFRPPFPINGGDKIRMIQMYNLLSNYYCIDILYLYSGKNDTKFPHKEFQFINKVHAFKISKFHSYLKTLKGFFLNDLPLQVNYYNKKSVQIWIDNNIHSYEYAFCGTIRMANYLKTHSLIKVLDFVDAISLNYHKAYEIQKVSLWKLIYRIDKARTLAYELKMIKHFQKRIIISEIDRDYLYQNMGHHEHIEVVENYVNMNKLQEHISEEDYILFVGKMNTKPNEHAVISFCENVFCKLNICNENIKFCIVGACPSNKVKNLARLYKNVIVTGYVDDLETVFLKSKIVVAPMVSGAGLQNKIIQAMNIGKCVVTTSIGAEGLHNVNKKREIVVEDNFQQMKMKIELLLKDSKKRKEIGRKGRDYVHSQFNMNRIKENLWQYLE